MKLSIELSDNETDKIINVVKEHIPELSKDLIGYGLNRFIRKSFDIGNLKASNERLQTYTNLYKETIKELKITIKDLKQKQKVKK